MKIIKHFFDNYNKLNKGYTSSLNLVQRDTKFHQKKFEHVLPPLEVVQEYEDIYPGTLAKLVSMAEAEQKHKHEVERVILKAQQLKLKLIQNVAIIGIIISIAAITILGLLSDNFYIFALTIVITLFITSAFIISRKYLRQTFAPKSLKTTKFIRKNYYRFR